MCCTNLHSTCQYARHMPICTAHAMQLVKAGSGCTSVGSVYCSVFLDADPDKVLECNTE